MTTLIDAVVEQTAFACRIGRAPTSRLTHLTESTETKAMRYWSADPVMHGYLGCLDRW